MGADRGLTWPGPITKAFRITLFAGETEISAQSLMRSWTWTGFSISEIQFCQYCTVCTDPALADWAMAPLPLWIRPCVYH